ncbi:electron transfer flavoprotein subunit beta/FixA family protein [Sporomusa acidovorans]|uniref:Electron transfer flavoprotein small subunit n=1 Tax=Sporomusa acidovorans (strain ATCC 49682 / DSM 3132 / Mol) TaxID=1123286 RepID=A0ABZ3J9B7_SPOA4|nr:electron transfer flavoprotein subunit beta/FixA family protein [Sporomusa acidovorans]OZC16111.1 electron transfer flavoprotein subunit beta [Sporomusa acidovorans DSM 3132]SDD86450.1 electron transfer flavoprotein beta subunit [Sporomusa acidovorans]
MPNIIACYKWVLDEQDIKINPGTLALDTSRAKRKISEYDRNAIEEAVLQAEKCGASVACLTFGDNSAKQSLKDALSRGPERAFWVNDNAAQIADGFVTANVLAAALRKIENYDLILCGEGSADSYGQQVGPRLATLLAIPAITFVSEMKVEDNKVVATRKIGDCTEVVTAEFPVVVTVLPEINKPRIPSLKQVLGAAKRPVVEWKIGDLGLGAAEISPVNKVKEIKGFVMSRKNVTYKDGTPAEKVAGLVASLAKEGVL